MRFELYTEESDDRTVYITGNFNNWNPRDSNYQLKQLDPHTYSIEIDSEILPDTVEYKFTKGGWENVELDKYGSITPNRKAKKTTEKTSDTVEKWRLNWGPFKKEFFPIAEVISEEFFIPQLDRYRKVMGSAPL